MCKKKFVIFDLDGTLVDSGQTVINACTQVMGIYGKEKNIKTILSDHNTCNNIEKLIASSAAACNLGLDTFRALYDKEYLKAPLHGTVKIDKTCDILHNERRQGNSVIVLTNKRQDIAQLVCDNIVGKGFIDHIIGRECVNIIKPHLVLERLSGLGIHPSQCLRYYGDSYNDLLTARVLDTIFINV